MWCVLFFFGLQEYKNRQKKLNRIKWNKPMNSNSISTETTPKIKANRLTNAKNLRIAWRREYSAHTKRENRKKKKNVLHWAKISAWCFYWDTAKIRNMTRKYGCRFIWQAQAMIWCECKRDTKGAIFFFGRRAKKQN